MVHRQHCAASFRVWLGCLLALSAASLVADPSPLPEPLTLEAALQAAQAIHPELILAEAEREAARARRDQVNARYGLQIGVLGRARWVEPSPLAKRIDDSHNDSSIGLELRKRLYDFGQTRASLAAADAFLAGRDQHLEAVRRQRRLQVMARYFDVRLADLGFRVQNESMAIAFVRLDRLRERSRLGQVSDVELLEAEARYQALRRGRAEAEAEQRSSRSRLAEALARPGELSRELVAPPLPGNDRAVPELGPVTEAALAGNPGLLALRAEVEGAEQRLAAARAGARPVLTGVLAATDYHRQFAGDDDLEAELELRVPLSTGGQVAADTALALAELKQARAALAQHAIAVRQEVFDTLEAIRVLQVQREEDRVLRDFRELDLDRSRSLYELEVTSDLGDAMSRFAAVMLQQARTEYELALAWERLALLTGEDRWRAVAAAGEPTSEASP